MAQTRDTDTDSETSCWEDTHKSKHTSDTFCLAGSSSCLDLSVCFLTDQSFAFENNSQSDDLGQNIEHVVLIPGSPLQGGTHCKGQ